MPDTIADTVQSDVANIQTTANKTPDGKFYIVNGYKKWITGMPTATHMTTAVRTGGPGMGGISVLVIPANSKGFSHRRIPNSGQKGGGASFVELDDVQVPVENILGKENNGFRIIMANFNKERFIMSIGCNRKARTCLSESFAYASTRHTFGKPLIANQIIAHKLATIGRYVESHWAWLEQLAYHIQHAPLGWQDPDIAGQIALSKVHGGRILEMANREAQQIFGGAGYQKGGPGAIVEQMSRDLRMMVSLHMAVRWEHVIDQVAGCRWRQRGDYRGPGRAPGDSAGQEERVEALIWLSGFKHRTGLLQREKRTPPNATSLNRGESQLSNPKRAHFIPTSYLPCVNPPYCCTQLQSCYYYHAPACMSHQKSNSPALMICR
jgi:hypothetical protein